MSKRSKNNTPKRVSNTYRRTTFGNTPLYHTEEDFFEDVCPVLKYIAKYRYTALLESKPELMVEITRTILKYGLIRFAGHYKITPDPLELTMRQVANLSTIFYELLNEPMGSELDIYVYKCNQKAIDGFVKAELGEGFSQYLISGLSN